MYFSSKKNVICVLVCVCVFSDTVGVVVASLVFINCCLNSRKLQIVIIALFAKYSMFAQFAFPVFQAARSVLSLCVFFLRFLFNFVFGIAVKFLFYDIKPQRQT